MSMSLWIWPLVWVAVGIAAAVVEGLTVQLVSIWFALSAAVTAVVTLMLHPAFSTQLLIFSLLGLVLLIGTRPFVRRKMKVKREATNADMVVGKTGIVTQDVRPETGNVRVTVTGMEWSARTPDGSPLTLGESVTVKAIEGATLIVEPQAIRK